jgi:hypothetical protein
MPVETITSRYVAGGDNGRCNRVTPRDFKPRKPERAPDVGALGL